ncbi:MAG TPA: hypothetical protein VJ879_08215 [Desulfobacter sp.]|nr:hypothetical protein [Desulfobacter sp.]
MRSAADQYRTAVQFSANLTYNFSRHFSLGTTISVFFPGDGTQDILAARLPGVGSAWDETAFCNYIEMAWHF